MNIADYIHKELIHVDFRARNKAQALTKIAALAAKTPPLKGVSEEQLHQLLAEREAAVSTGIGHGVAIPHARLDALKDFVILVLLAPDGVDYDAIDRRRVQIFFVVLAPSDKVAEHLKVLAGLARMLSQTTFRKEALKTRTPEILYEVLVRHLSGETPVAQGDRQKRRLLLIVLYYDQLLNDVLEYLIDMNVDGATILRSEGMGAYISNLPLFASFLGFMREDVKISHTILTLIPEQDEARIVRGIESITGDLDKTRGAMVMTLDVAFYKGTMDML